MCISMVDLRVINIHIPYSRLHLLITVNLYSLTIEDTPAR